jgi:hypothetical protein
MYNGNTDFTNNVVVFDMLQLLTYFFSWLDPHDDTNLQTRPKKQIVEIEMKNPADYDGGFELIHSDSE